MSMLPEFPKGMEPFVPIRMHDVYCDESRVG